MNIGILCTYFLCTKETLYNHLMRAEILYNAVNGVLSFSFRITCGNIGTLHQQRNNFRFLKSIGSWSLPTPLRNKPDGIY